MLSVHKRVTIFTSTRKDSYATQHPREEVNRLAETLAARKHINKTDALKQALENELRHLDQALSLRERLRPLQDRVMARPATGLEADKAFYDDLSEEQ